MHSTSSDPVFKLPLRRTTCTVIFHSTAMTRGVKFKRMHCCSSRSGSRRLWKVRQRGGPCRDVCCCIITCMLIVDRCLLHTSTSRRRIGRVAPASMPRLSVGHCMALQDPRPNSFAMTPMPPISKLLKTMVFETSGWHQWTSSSRCCPPSLFFIGSVDSSPTSMTQFRLRHDRVGRRYEAHTNSCHPQSNGATLPLSARILARCAQ
jgi:hypothetical protein